MCINDFLDGIIFLNFNPTMNHGWISVGLTMINGRYSTVRDDFFTFFLIIFFILVKMVRDDLLLGLVGLENRLDLT